MSIFTDTGSRCTITSHELPSRGRDDVVTVASEDITDMRITVATGPKRDGKWIACTFAE